MIIFIDFCKAFDTIDRSKMFDILRAYENTGKIVKAIAIMYGNTTARVVSPEGNTDYLEILSRVLQRDTFYHLPFLLIIITDYGLRKAKKIVKTWNLHQ